MRVGRLQGFVWIGIIILEGLPQVYELSAIASSRSDREMILLCELIMIYWALLLMLLLTIRNCSGSDLELELGLHLLIEKLLLLLLLLQLAVTTAKQQLIIPIAVFTSHHISILILIIVILILIVCIILLQMLILWLIIVFLFFILVFILILFLLLALVMRLLIVVFNICSLFSHRVAILLYHLISSPSLYILVILTTWELLFKIYLIRTSRNATLLYLVVFIIHCLLFRWLLRITLILCVRICGGRPPQLLGVDPLEQSWL